jgi:CheY-like chemotaxis protein
VRSTVGVGTAFTVELPLQRDVDTSVPDIAGAVLVVDDDETARYVVEAHLRDTAWRTVTVGGGEAALAALEQALPAAMILDLSMPDLDGSEVLRRMRADARTAAVPVIVHTSRLLGRAEAERLEALGAHLLDKSGTSRSQLLEVLSIATRAAR